MASKSPMAWCCTPNASLTEPSATLKFSMSMFANDSNRTKKVNSSVAMSLKVAIHAGAPSSLPESLSSSASSSRDMASGRLFFGGAFLRFEACLELFSDHRGIVTLHDRVDALDDHIHVVGFCLGPTLPLLGNRIAHHECHDGTVHGREQCNGHGRTDRGWVVERL